MECTLCQNQQILPVSSQVYAGQAWHCQTCDLIFKDPKDVLSWDLQKTRYDQHSNDINQPGYVQYFEQLLMELDPYLQKFDIKLGLDWGSGPEPVLQELLKRRNVKLDIYDPIYHNHVEILEETYPLLTCTEVIEHFAHPRKSLVQMEGYLSSGSIFAGMTNLHQGPEHFSNWWYVRDTTHVSFYSEKTLKWVAEFLGLEILVLLSPIFIFQKR